MKLVTVLTDQGPRACGEFEGSYVDLNYADSTLPSTVKGLLALGPEGVERMKVALPRGGWKHDPAKCTLLAPVPDAAKIVCLGLNYRDHAAESGMEVPTEPILFSKYPTTLIGQGAEIVLPASSQEVDYEAELVIVVGRGGRHIERDRAMEHVGGYAVGNDVSARDWQLGKPGKQWMAGKTFDTFAPLGPFVVTPDEVPDPQALGIRARVNGRTMQDSNTSQLVFGVAEVIEYLSAIFTLEPGDLIFTGTPPGVGMARKPPVWLQPGDIVEIEIDGLGTLRNPVVRH
ncbi:fumarylacetoacetate hydrolase family protein [Tundrisphaera lichenicola]|uniref:fumarylacetoacetate hydrolase family protein n=1 Tax=Tundrisphaera lichenicola TaxID=2029860 RepID=UPI003EBA842C